MNGGPQEAGRGGIWHRHWLHVRGAVHWLVEVHHAWSSPVNNLLPVYWVLTEKLACQIAEGPAVEMPAESISQ